MPGLRHALDQDAVEREAALARDVLQLLPGGFELVQIGDAQDDAADIAFMRQRRAIAASPRAGSRTSRPPSRASASDVASRPCGILTRMPAR